MNIHSVGILLGTVSVFLYGYTLPGLQLNLFAGVLLVAMGAVVIALGRQPLFLSVRVLMALSILISVGAIGVFNRLADLAQTEAAHRGARLRLLSDGALPERDLEGLGHGFLLPCLVTPGDLGGAIRPE